MADHEVCVDVMANMMAQFNADNEKKVSIPALLQYNMLVAQANALNSLGVLTDFTAIDVFTEFDIALQASGYPLIRAEMVAHGSDWEEAWPVPLGT